MIKDLEGLKEHLNKHNDAVIILGSFDRYNNEKHQEFYNKKTLRRNYEDTIKYYFDNIDKELDTREILKLIPQIPHKEIINQNINSDLVASNLHGHVMSFKCMKCNVLYVKIGLQFDNNSIMPCECCGGKIRPTVLLHSENYNQNLVDSIYESLDNTHTVFFINVDFSEPLMMEIMNYYSDVIHLNEVVQKNKTGERIIIAIEDKDEFDVKSLVKCNFYVKGDLTDSIKRLLEGIK